MLANLDLYGRILILSPHLDDAVLSVGGLIEAAVTKGVDVVVGTTLTADAPELLASSPTILDLHARWGLGPNPYRVRREEDIAAVRMLGADFIHGDLLDSIYRTDEAGDFVYPSLTSRFSTPSSADPIRPVLRALLARWIKSVEPTLILCPLGVGRHIDHVLTSEVLQELRAQEAMNVFLYEDMPYSAGIYPIHAPDTVLAALSRSAWTVGAPVVVRAGVDLKATAVMEYSSQVKGLFANNLNVAEELRRYMKTEDGEGFQERLWSVL